MRSLSLWKETQGTVTSPELWPRRGRNLSGARTLPASSLSDEQWHVIQDLIVEEPTGGRPRIASRPSLEGILRVLSQGACWKD